LALPLRPLAATAVGQPRWCVSMGEKPEFIHKYLILFALRKKELYRRTYF
jgi:hypothetical protein